MPADRRYMNYCGVMCATVMMGLGMIASPAAADPTGGPPNFIMTWDASGDNLPPHVYNPINYGTVNFGTFTLGGGANGAGGYVRERTGWRYEGSLNNPLWSLSWDCVVDPDPYVDATINVTNNSLATQTFWIFMPLPITPAITVPTLMSGWVSAVVSDNNFDGATFAAAAGFDVYRGHIDGAQVAQMWGPGFSLSASPFGSNNANMSFSNVIGPQALVDIALALRFDLSPGDSASVTGIFEVQPIPGPAGLSVLALVAALGGRRRRN